ncbi:MAG: HAD-IC family P-type ATPase [Candidatus Limnocylindrales bacterium]
MRSSKRAPADGPGPPAPDALWHALDASEIEERLGTRLAGQAEADARERLATHGPNRLREKPPPSVLTTLLNQFKSPLIYILLIAATVTILLGEYLDAIVIVAVLVLNAGVGFFQERQAEKSVRALMHLVAARAHVVRDGIEREIDAAEVVPGDLVLLESGGRIPADLRLVSSVALAIDESLLTGESKPAAKSTNVLPEDTSLADRRNMAFSGSVVSSGRGRGYVVATGVDTELGRISEMVRGEEERDTPLQHRMGRFARIIGAVVFVAAGAAVALGVAQGQELREMFIAGVAMAVSAIPEGLPVVLTITLALGVRRMARRRAIIRRLPAVETLGSATVIGSDKTGTMTENRMTVIEVWAAGSATAARGETDGQARVVSAAADSPLRMTLLTGIMTNEASLGDRDSDDASEAPTAAPAPAAHKGDPTEVALLVSARHFGLDVDGLRRQGPIRDELPFEPARQYSAAVRDLGGVTHTFVKGAPERVVRMCDRMLTADGIEPIDAGAVGDAAGDMAARGLRVLGMAYHDGSSGDGVPDLEDGLRGLVFAGLQGMQDPPRAGVKEAIAGCRRSGIRVVMITGDHAETARSIAFDLGLHTEAGRVLTGSELKQLDADALTQRAREVSVYARVSPDQKLRIVKSLQDDGEVVALTGDGVNDAPALKAADIGVAMGRSGTDVAREASDMVLTDDDFVSIYAAVEEGRVTFENIRKVTFFLVSTGAAEVALILGALLLAYPLPLLPAQILWLNLVTNGLQDVALAFEPGEGHVLQRPPRRRSEDVMSRLLWERTVLAGLVMAVGTFAMFAWELDGTGSLASAQTVALMTMVVFQMFQAFNSRSEVRSVFRMDPFSNPFLLVSIVGAFLISVVALYIPVTQLILRVEPIGLDAWLRIVAVASTLLLAMEIHKYLRNRWPVGRSRRPRAASA